MVEAIAACANIRRTTSIRFVAHTRGGYTGTGIGTTCSSTLVDAGNIPGGDAQRLPFRCGPLRSGCPRSTDGTVNLSVPPSRMQTIGRGHGDLLATRAANFRPDLECLGPGSSILCGSDMIAAEVEQVIDLIVG